MNIHHYFNISCLQIDEENEAVIDERFPIEAQETRDRSCGRRPLVDGYPRVVPTLYSPAPAPLYPAPALPYIVNGQEARRHEYPFMVRLTHNQDYKLGVCTGAKAKMPFFWYIFPSHSVGTCSSRPVFTSIADVLCAGRSDEPAAPVLRRLPHRR